MRKLILLSLVQFAVFGAPFVHADDVLEYDYSRRENEGYRAALAYTITKELCEKRTQVQDRRTDSLRHTDRQFLDFCNARLKQCLRPLTGVYLVDDYPWERKSMPIDTAAEALGVAGAGKSMVGWCHFIANGKGVEADEEYTITMCQADFGKIILDFLKSQEGMAKVGKKPVNSTSAVGVVPADAACRPREEVIASIARFHLPKPRNETAEQKYQRFKAERELIKNPEELEKAILLYLSTKFGGKGGGSGSGSGGSDSGSD